MSNAFRARGHECFTVDWNEKFPSSLHIDIEKITTEIILEKFGHPDVIWIGTDCTSYSIAAISHHRRKNPETGNLDPVSDYAKKCDRMNQHVKKIVEELNPQLYFWENPRAGLRKMIWMQDLPRYTISYCKYETDKPVSERRMKPTDIWCNHPNPKFKPMCHNGNPDHAAAPRGSKTGTQGMKNAEERSMYPKCDLLTFSFPCQSISIAGKQEGIIKGETRSGLVYEIVRLIEKSKEEGTLPKYLLLENVSALVSKKFIDDFNNLNSFFNDIGYNVYWNLINGKDCGVPQNRSRCFAIYIRKDIDNGKFEFPIPFDTGIRLKDILEDEVNEKYYISDDKVQKFLANLNYVKCEEDNNNPQFIGNINRSDFGTGYAGGVWDNDNISPTLTTMQGGGRQPHIMCGTDNTLNSHNIRIRKITPKEAFRLMGLSDEDYTAASQFTSDSQIYKQAGNGIITNCCELLAEHLYKAQYDDTYVCTDELINSKTDDDELSNRLIVLGNTVPSGHTAGRIFDTNGISPTVMERHSKVVQIAENFHKPQVE